MKSKVYDIHYGGIGTGFSIFVRAKNKKQASFYEKIYGETHEELDYIKPVKRNFAPKSGIINITKLNKVV